MISLDNLQEFSFVSLVLLMVKRYQGGTI